MDTIKRRDGNVDTYQPWHNNMDMIKTNLVIGLGEVGGPLRDILCCDGYDDKTGWTDKPVISTDALHICLPYSAHFTTAVKEYQDRFMPQVTVIHSTVPIGTTDTLVSAVHSPVLGMHRTMKRDMLRHIKYIGGRLAYEIEPVLQGAGFGTRSVPFATWTEALKLLCLAKHGLSIAMAQYQDELCKKVVMDYHEVNLWDMHHNLNVGDDRKRPVLHSPEGRIGGHCVIPGTRMLNEYLPSELLDEVLKLG